jgi:eukaryotic-like serine/threonine-protein kinase
MPLAAATRLGPYEIIAPLGAGGMGEVYRARDTRLGREVAIKILSAGLSSSAEVRARFEREARTVSSLNHPHICTLHDVGREGDTDYLVMELVDGETLAERLTRGALPIDDVLRLGAQIADALDRAHRAGVVHRDLKPGNIMLTRAGAKLMDFGLARETGLAPASRGPSGIGLSQSPTIAHPLTAEGTIVGTFQYMAPEQLEGKEIDARADVWALGCVLYEMATGRRAFEGASQASLISAIMKDTPRPIAELVPMSPPSLDRVVRRCLAKDRDDRWQSARDVGLELADLPADVAPTNAAAVPAQRGASRMTWVAAAVALLALAALGVVLWRSRGAGEVPAMHLTLSRPTGAPYTLFGGCQISPDSRQIVFLGETASGEVQLFVRPVASDEARPLEGTVGARMPFWSPDARNIGFFQAGKLKRMSIAGGPPQTLCDVPHANGGSWGSAGTIVFAGVQAGCVCAVPETGGTPREVTKLAPGEEAHRWPSFLGDGRHFVYLLDANRTEQHWLCVGSIEGHPPRKLLQGAITNAIFVAPHWLLYVRGGTLLAQHFDSGAMKLVGDPVTIGRQIAEMADNHLFEFSAAPSGMVLYRSMSPETQLAWLDRTGHHVADIGKPQRYRDARLSPDGRSIAYVTGDEDGRSADIWLLDPARDLATRLTSDPASDFEPVFSPDGSRIAFGTYRTEPGSVEVTSTTGSDAETPLLAVPGVEVTPIAWSPDGRWLVVTAYRISETQVRLVDVAHRDSGRIILPASGANPDVHFSPDGRWIAYVSDRSGDDEVYVQDFPGGTQRRQVSSGGGDTPRWAAGGREIIFANANNQVAAATVKTTGGLSVDVPRPLFSLDKEDWADVSPDGQRFLVRQLLEPRWSAPVQVVTNWMKLAER